MESIISVLLGIIFGVIAGLIPGIHPNLITSVAISLIPSILPNLNTFIICSFIISLAVTNTVVDVIPSTFLGAPESENVLSVLPGHRLLLKGRGYEAIMLTIYGSVFSSMFIFLSSPLLIRIFPPAYFLVRDYIWVIVICALLIIFTKEKNFLSSILIFFLSGVFGLIVFSKEINEPLFPMLSGFFGVSSLIVSMAGRCKIPNQKFEFKISKRNFKIAVISALMGCFSGFTPGLGPSQCAMLSRSFVKEFDEKNYLVLVGGLTTTNMIVSIITLYTIRRARNGAIAGILKLTNGVSFFEFIFLMLVSLISLFVAATLTKRIAKIFLLFMRKINYFALSLGIILFIFLAVFFISGVPGILVLIGSSLIGLLTIANKIKRCHMMGCLILPLLTRFF